MRRYLSALHLPAEDEYHCFSGFDRKTFRTSSLFTITYNFSPRATLSFLRYVFVERKRIYCKIGNMLFGGKGAFFTELKRRCFGEKADFSQSWKGVASEKKRIYHGAEKALLRRKDGFATERIVWCVVLKPFKQSYVAAAHQKSVWKSCFFGIIFLKSHWLYVVYHI